MTRIRRWKERLNSNDSGVVAIWVALLTPVLFMMCAFAVDSARWYVEGARLQKTVDAAALAGVPYMPQDFATAQSTASNFINRNGYTVGPNVTASILPGDRSSQLQVTMSSTIPNSFAVVFGFKTQTLTRSATAEYTGPAPLGSPCNTFANEPAASSAAPDGANSPITAPSTGYSNCTRFPQFWATAVGPNVAKSQGDRFLARNCGGDESGCDTGTPRPNCAFIKHDSLLGLTEECKEESGQLGYVYAVKVFNPSAVTSVRLQLYDAAYVDTGSECAELPNVTTNTINAWVNDGQIRYEADADPVSSTVPSFCAGDADNRSTSGDILSFNASNQRNNSDAGEISTVTSFGLLQPTETYNPFDPAVNASKRVPSCAKQYPGFSMVARSGGGRTWRTDQSGVSLSTASSSNTTLQQLSTTNDLTRYFHQWTNFCTFNPSLYVSPGSREATFYLRVRTNVAWNDTNGVYSQLGDNSAMRGNGANRFSIRAITSTATSVAVSAYERQPIFANTTNAEQIFPLVRVTPGSAGQNLVFSFFDIGDATGGSGATLQVLRPLNAAGANLSNCRAGLNGRLPSGQALSNCQVTGIANTGNTSTTWNGRYQQIVVPIPADYSCNVDDYNACWFRVRVQFNGTTSVTDQTTWTAFLEGDPVRLVK